MYVILNFPIKVADNPDIKSLKSQNEPFRCLTKMLDTRNHNFPLSIKISSQIRISFEKEFVFDTNINIIMIFCIPPLIRTRRVQKTGLENPTKPGSPPTRAIQKLISQNWRITN